MKSSWNVCNYDVNADEIRYYDVFANSKSELQEVLGESKGDYNLFEKRLGAILKARYWSRCEYELILRIEHHPIEGGGKIHYLLRPWIGRHNGDSAEINVTNDENFSWDAFAYWILDKKNESFPEKGETVDIKFDVWDQLKFGWDSFVEEAWIFVTNCNKEDDREDDREDEREEDPYWVEDDWDEDEDDDEENEDDNLYTESAPATDINTLTIKDEHETLRFTVRATSSPYRYEVNKYCKDGTSCFTIAWLEYEKKESDFELASVGMRFVEHSHPTLNKFLKAWTELEVIKIQAREGED